MAQDAEINHLRSVIEEQSQEIRELHMRLEELEIQTQEVSVEKITYLNKELDTWKQRFIQLNRDYHTNQERLLMVEAELESQKKKEVREVKVRERSMSRKWSCNKNIRMGEGRSMQRNSMNWGRVSTKISIDEYG